MDANIQFYGCRGNRIKLIYKNSVTYEMNMMMLYICSFLSFPGRSQLPFVPKLCTFKSVFLLEVDGTGEMSPVCAEDLTSDCGWVCDTLNLHWHQCSYLCCDSKEALFEALLLILTIMVALWFRDAWSWEYRMRLRDNYEWISNQSIAPISKNVCVEIAYMISYWSNVAYLGKIAYWRNASKTTFCSDNK